MKPTERFSNRVHEYILYRPGYAGELIQFLDQTCGGLGGKSIADIGSGTGKLTEPLLHALATVHAVEPNREMRQAAERMLTDYKDFHSVAATAESIGLPDNSVDIIVSAQAFHWFDKEKAKAEFTRILKDEEGYVFLIWNNRNNDPPFTKEYEDFLVKYSTDYTMINHKNISSEELEAFFGDDGYEEIEFENNQYFDFNGLKGRYDSCSYALPLNDELYPESISSLQSLFDKYVVDGEVTMYANTKVHYGRL